METKSIFKSRTFWFNAIMAILAGIVAISDFLNADVLAAFGFGPETTKRVLTIVGFLAAIGNIYLRKKTTQPVTSKKNEPGT